MTTVADILKFVETLAPRAMKMDWDNVGLLCGSKAAEVTKVLVALDPFEGVCHEASDIGAQLIVTHHPMMFSAIRIYVPVVRIQGINMNGSIITGFMTIGRPNVTGSLTPKQPAGRHSLPSVLKVFSLDLIISSTSAMISASSLRRVFICSSSLFLVQ